MSENRIEPPERPGGQGLDANQEESGNRAIAALLTDPVRGGQTDLVITCRDGAYEAWAKRGMVRFQRFYADGGGYGYRVIEQIGENPIANQDPTALATLAQELEAGAKSGYSGTDPAQAFVEPEQLSYPLAMERIAQLFDSPNAPDIVISPRSYAFGRQPGQHGALDVVQSRAPLVLSGPGVRPAVTETTALGAAYLAGLATGFWRGTDEVAENWRIDRRFSPQMPAEQREELYAGWKRAVERTVG